MKRRYRYFAIVDLNYGLDNPYALAREWDTGPGRTAEEFFSPRLVWEPADLIDRARNGRDNNDASPITERDAQRYVELLTRRFQQAQARLDAEGQQG